MLLRPFLSEAVDDGVCHGGRTERVGGTDGADEGVMVGMPRMEAVMVELWMCVPEPGVWDFEGARGRPG